MWNVLLINFIFAASLAKAEVTCQQFFARKVLNPNYAEKIIAKSKRVQKPAVVFDLDETLFFVAPRILAAMKAYDQARQTSFFSQFGLESIRSELIHEFIKEVMDGNLKDHPEKDPILHDARKFIQDFFHTSQNLRLDSVNNELSDILRVFHRTGIHIIYLTGRWEMQREVSREMLQSAGLPEGELILAPGKTVVSEFKKARIEDLQNSGLNILAVFDDNTPNLLAIQSLGLNIDLFKVENKNMKMTLTLFE